MATADELRAEAARMREFALTVTDPEVLAEINIMIAEWERRAREMSNGGGEITVMKVGVVFDRLSFTRQQIKALPASYRQALIVQRRRGQLRIAD